MSERAMLIILGLMLGFSPAASAQKETVPVKARPAAVTKNPQAISIVQAALAAAAGPPGLAGYQDAVAQGTLHLTIGKAADMPIVLKCKGPDMTRVETHQPKGKSIRIVNQGVGVYQQPDGHVRHLLMNNTLAERANFIPVFSLLAEYQNPAVSVEYVGTGKVNGRAAQVVALRPIPVKGMSQAELDRTTTKTQFSIDQVNSTILKIAYTNFAENNPDDGDKVEVYLWDYRPVGSGLVPFRQTEFVDGNLSTDLTLSSVVFNKGLSDSEFALPH